MTYDKAKLKDISDEAGISLGSLYFHFGNKDDIAEAVLQTQRDRLSEITVNAMNGKGTGRERLFQLFDGYAKVISADTIVQAGILLVSSLPDELKNWGQSFHGEWRQLCLNLIREGVTDGSITSSWPVEDLNELLNEMFEGAQVLSGVEDGWASFPKRIDRAKPLYEMLLSS